MWDAHQRQLLAASDRMSKKPLSYPSFSVYCGCRRLLEVDMRKISVRLCVAFLFLTALPLGCTSSPSSSPKGSGGSGGSSARTGGAGGGTSATGGGTGGSSSKGSGGASSTGTGGSTSTGGGSGGSTETGGGGGTSEATGGSSATGGNPTGGTSAGTGGGTSDVTGGSSATGGRATGGTGGMSTGGGTSPLDGGTDATGGNRGDAQDGHGGDVAGNSGNDGGEGETGASCTDSVQNGAETDVDCGGGTCAKCASGRMCNVDDDCRNGSCTSGKCADSFVATATVTQNGNMWRITLGTVIFEVDPANSGKVATFSIDGTDVVAKNMASTGSVFWTSPQSDWIWPPPSEMDGAAYTPSVSGNVLTLTGPVGDDLLSFSKRYWGNVDHQAVTLEYTIHNANSVPVKKAPWEITRVYAGGLTFFPNADTWVRLGDASFSILPVSTAQGAVWFNDNATNYTSNVKGGADGLEGWAAHIACGTGLKGSWAYPTCANSPILIKEWTDTPASDETVNPTEREVEIYVDSGNSYEEFEQQGLFQSIPAGGTLVWTMHWLLRYLPSDMLPISDSTKLPLLTWVRGQLL